MERLGLKLYQRLPAPQKTALVTPSRYPGAMRDDYSALRDKIAFEKSAIYYGSRVRCGASRLDFGLSILRILRDEESDSPSAYGNGFAIAPGIVATCDHVIDGASRIYACIGTAPYCLDFEILCRESNSDAALLRVSPASAVPLPFLPLAPDDEIVPGMDVLCAASYAGSGEEFLKQHNFAWRTRGKLIRFADLPEQAGFQALVLDAAATKGCSGSPVLDSNHRVCGMVARGGEGKETGRIAAVHVGVIRRLLSSVGTKDPACPVMGRLNPSIRTTAASP